MPTALLREVPDTFDRAIVSDPGRVPDVKLARTQHSRYRKALEQVGFQVEVLPGDDAYPDCVFIEDTAVVLGSLAVACRPGAESRRGEVRPVAARLGSRVPVFNIESPGTVDGGDVMVMGDVAYVGLSRRTNEEGIAQLAKMARSQGMTVRTVPVQQGLHLKSGVLPIDAETVVITPGAVDEAMLSGLRVLYEDPAERGRFTALPLGDGKVLVAGSAPATASMTGDLGFEPIAIDVSEFQAADGGLTCMSIVLDV